MKKNWRLFLFLPFMILLLFSFLFLRSSFFDNGYRRDPVSKAEYYASHDVEANNEAKMKALDELEKKALEDFKKSRGLLPSTEEAEIPIIKYRDLEAIYPSDVPEFPTQMTLYHVTASSEEAIVVERWDEDRAVLGVGGAKGNSYHRVEPDSFPLVLMNHERGELVNQPTIPIGWCGDRFLWAQSREKDGSFYTDVMILEGEQKMKKLFTVQSDHVIAFVFSETQLFYNYEFSTDSQSMVSRLASYSFEDQTQRVLWEETLQVTADKKLTGTILRRCGGNEGTIYFEVMKLEKESPDHPKAVTLYRYDPLKQESVALFSYEKPFSWFSGQDGLFYGVAQTGERVLMDLKQMKGYSVPSIDKSWNEGFYSFAGKDGFYFDGGSGFFFVDPNNFKLYITPWSSLEGNEELKNCRIMKGWLWDGGCGLTMATSTPGEFVIAVFENTLGQ